VSTTAPWATFARTKPVRERAETSGATCRRTLPDALPRTSTTGEVVPVELFVGVLGASSYVYAEACPSQDLASWITAHVRMVEFWGGAPALFVPDNLRSGVTQACRYEPVINRTYLEFAQHYGAAVVPARAGRPRDKAVVEANVLVVQRWILAVLRDRRFFSLAELNAAIWALLPGLNARRMKKLGVSRRDLFEQLDRPLLHPLLRPLPATRYELAEWSDAGVNIDYHVAVAHNYYSVPPPPLLHERVEVRLTVAIVEVFLKGRRVAAHRRRRGRGEYATDPAHMPHAHRAHAEWTPSRLIAWAATTGPATAELVAAILATKPHPEQGYRACLGLMRLGQTHGVRLEAAAARALQLGAPSYRTVQNILASGADRVPLADGPAPTPSLPVHPNIRGRAYYTREEPRCSLTPPSKN
jgi:transposase